MTQPQTISQVMAAIMREEEDSTYRVTQRRPTSRKKTAMQSVTVDGVRITRANWAKFCEQAPPLDRDTNPYAPTPDLVAAYVAAVRARRNFRGCDVQAIERETFTPGRSVYVATIGRRKSGAIHPAGTERVSVDTADVERMTRMWAMP